VQRPTFWELFWFAALLTAPALGGVVGLGLKSWLGLPSWVVVASPLVGLAGLFTVVWVLVRFDDRRRSRKAERDAVSDRST
jgi:hypothetical protein